MNDSELLDWLDQQEDLSITQGDDGYWHIRTGDQYTAVGYPFIRQAIQIAKEQNETNRTL